MDLKTAKDEEFTIHGGFDQNTISAKYDELSKNYEEVYKTVGWPDPKICAQHCLDNGYTADSTVLDMGCGTGLVGEELALLAKIEKPHVIGIDASDKMLDQATSKNVYESVKNVLLCNPEEFKANNPEYIGAFDFVCASGLLAEGHATNEVFDEMVLSLKTGGYAIFTVRSEYLTKLNYQTGMDERVESGKWELTKKSTHEKYSNAAERSVGRFAPTETCLFVFKKL